MVSEDTHRCHAFRQPTDGIFDPSVDLTGIRSGIQGDEIMLHMNENLFRFEVQRSCVRKPLPESMPVALTWSFKLIQSSSVVESFVVFNEFLLDRF